MDSSVALFLLKEKGFSPVGVFMNLWKEKGGSGKSQAQERAQKVCSELDVPFEILDLKDEFKEKVVNYFTESYKKGITPNPCVVCNREVKFNFLMEKLNTLEADYVATGHYVRLCREIRNVLPKESLRASDERVIYRGKDREKDQSYFLWNLKKEWLPKIIFPLGDFKKEEVRKMAEKYSLPTAKEKESQEVCFIEKNVFDFLGKNISSSPGKIVDTKGNVIGNHEGLFYYTQGQRKKIGLSHGPYYVLRKNIKENILVVTKNEKDLFSKEVFYGKGNFLRKVSFPFKAKVQIRYKSKARTAVVEKGKIIFSSPQRAITPGQSAVFYKGEELVGGGIIK